MSRFIAMLARAAVLAFTAMILPAAAGAGHDHGGAAPAVGGSGPQRQPDGSVFLPKPAQRQIGVRTLVAELKMLPRSLELPGKVVMDSNAGGKVQALLAGRLEPGPGGLPAPGQSVRKGQVLAYVVPSASAIERSNQVAQLAELRANHALARKRVARLRELSDSVPQKEIEAAESDVSSLADRIAAVGAGLTTRDTLAAPVSGVISTANAVSGQVVEARELIFEVIDPARLHIEALAFDAGTGADVAAAFVPLGADKAKLKFIGASRALREQALPLIFQAAGPHLSRLAVGQPVVVVVQTRTQVKGVPLPSAALVKNPANQTVVWVKTAPERFEPRVVTVEPLDGTTVTATSGIGAGDRVVTQGATLINQVR